MDIEQVESTAELTVRNIGGIDQTEVSFQPGVTILSGRNATNRTSLLQAIMAALGSDDVSIKADAEEGHAELTLDGETYTRTLERQNETVHLSGDPFLEDSERADLFAFLVESNEARRAVVTDADLRDIIMRPVDTDEIQAEIERQLEQRQQISNELEEIEDLKKRLPPLEENRTQLQDDIEETKVELEELEAEIEVHETDIEKGHEEQEELEAKLAELRETRSELEDVRYELETEQESRDLLRTEKREIEEAFEELSETSPDRLDDLDDRIDRLRTRKQELETELNEIQSAIRFNEDRLEDGPQTFSNVFDAEEESVIDELLPDETVTCWTCGSNVEVEEIETTIEKLQGLGQELVGKINDLEAELEEVTEQRRDLKNHRQRRETLERRQEELESELDEIQAHIEALEERRDALCDEVEAIEMEVEELETETHTEILDLHKEANQLEYQLGQLETDLERVEENIASVEERLDEEDKLKAQREEFSDEITDLRTRIENMEKKAIENFNDHMETVLELLEYANLARIWLERRETEVQEGRQTATKSVFDLHIVRQTKSGTTYEDTISNLSESEREVTGLVFALSGYLAHDIYETVPFILLDSVEALDTSRVATLVEYMSAFSEYLVVALLPEYDDVLTEDYPRIIDI